MGFALFNWFKKIMIVEDDRTLRGALAAKLKQRGFRVVEVGDAHEALARIGTEKPHLLVLDLILPMKDGISLLEELRISGHTLPVIILSNLLGSGPLKEDAKRLNAQFYNKASTSLDEVTRVIEERIS